MLRSSEPIALVIDDTSSGTIRHFSIRRNRSPGYWMYITSRSVQGTAEFFKIRPSAVPPNTPHTVRKVRRFDLTNCFHRGVGLAPVVAYEFDMTLEGSWLRISCRNSVVLNRAAWDLSESGYPQVDQCDNRVPAEFGGVLGFLSPFDRDETNFG